MLSKDVDRNRIPSNPGLKRRFLRTTAYKLSRVNVPLNILAIELGLELLACRRLFGDVAFVHELINCKLSCLELLRKKIEL